MIEPQLHDQPDPLAANYRLGQLEAQLTSAQHEIGRLERANASLRRQRRKAVKITCIILVVLILALFLQGMLVAQIFVIR